MPQVYWDFFLKIDLSTFQVFYRRVGIIFKSYVW